jgi:hypothetical protein
MRTGFSRQEIWLPVKTESSSSKEEQTWTVRGFIFRILEYGEKTNFLSRL